MTAQNATADARCNFPVWRTVTIGSMKTADDFRCAIKSAGMKIGTWANDLLGRFIPSAEGKTLNLVKVTVAELGFRSGAALADIYARAKELGLELCPAEVGPQLRLQYADQPYGEWLWVAMEPIMDSDGDPSIFSVDHGRGDRWLDGSSGRAGYFWIGCRRFVFVRRN